MINKTNDYSLFAFRSDNREKISYAQVDKLKSSIESRNLLELKPIIVNDKFEIIDGQHRLLAAEKLGVDVYYIQEKTLGADDIIRMNTAKKWSINDYLNFYCKHDYPEYIKLKNFMERNEIATKIAINIALGSAKGSFERFRLGKFKFNEGSLSNEIEVCKTTISTIKKMNGYSMYTHTNRFWGALLKFVRHPRFKANKWYSNMNKMISHFSAKASTEDYLVMFVNVYNWHNKHKIYLDEKNQLRMVEEIHQDEELFQRD
jgi:hypothetical protein